MNAVKPLLVPRSKPHIPEGLQRVGDMLSAAIESSGMTQKDVAARLNVSEARVSQMLTGDANLTVKTLIKIATILEMDLQIGLFHTDKK